jgi:ABC-type nitrate/sulfonate/bicarbonate transport system substrate-binding protein
MKRTLDRRGFMKLGATAAASTAVGGHTLLSAPPVLAADAKPVSFQLSWIKSIQYGGYFAGIDNGSFAKFGVDPTFVSGGPNIDPIANVAAGQSQLGDRPIGSLLIARHRFPEEPLCGDQPRRKADQDT